MIIIFRGDIWNKHLPTRKLIKSLLNPKGKVERRLASSSKGEERVNRVKGFLGGSGVMIF